MIPRIHMQDQVHDRIKDIMGEKNSFSIEELFHSIATMAIVIVFLLLGLNW